MYFSSNAWSVARCFALKKRVFTVPQLTHTAYGELHGKVGERRAVIVGQAGLGNDTTHCIDYVCACDSPATQFAESQSVSQHKSSHLRLQLVCAQRPLGSFVQLVKPQRHLDVRITGFLVEVLVDPTEDEDPNVALPRRGGWE